MKYIIPILYIFLLVLFISTAISVANMPPNWNNVTYLWHFDSDWNNSATTGGAMTWNLTAGKGVNYSVDYMAGSGYISCHDECKMETEYSDSIVSGDLTISFWMKTNDNNTNIFEKYNSTGGGVFILNFGSANTSDFFYYHFYPNAVTKKSYEFNTNVSVSESWFHLVVTVNGSKVKMYVNNSLADVHDYGTGYGNASTDWHFELFQGLTAGKNISIDELAVFNELLTTDSISDIFLGDYHAYSDIKLQNDSYSGYTINFTSDYGHDCGYAANDSYYLCGPSIDTSPTFRAYPNSIIADFRIYKYNGTYFNYTTLNDIGYNYSNCTYSGNEIVCTVSGDLVIGINQLAITGNSTEWEQNSINESLANTFNYSLVSDEYKLELHPALYSNFSQNFAVNYSLAYDQLNWSDANVISGNFTWNFTEHNISVFNASWVFNFSVYVEKDFLLYMNTNLNNSIRELWCDGANVTTSQTLILKSTLSETKFNCTLNLFNISQSYSNWTLVSDSPSWAFNYTVNITETGG